MICTRARVVALFAVATAFVLPSTAAAQAPELAPADESFSCRASAVRVADGTAADSNKLEPFVANRDVFPCVDDDAGVPSLTQVPGSAGPTDPRATLGAAFARTRDGQAEPPGEAPPPPEELGVTTSQAGAATVLLTNGDQVVLANAVRATASVRCVNGRPVFSSSSEVVGVTLGGPDPTIVLPPADDPATPEDESRVDIPDAEGPIHINWSGTTTDPATGVTTHTRRALWIENGDNGDGGEIVVGEAQVDTRGNPCTGRVTIVKNAVPDSPQDFTFTGLPTATDTFVLDDDPADAAVPRSRTFDVVPGTYTVTEAAATGFQLRDVTCAGDAGPAGASSPTQANIDLQARDDVTCTFLNISDAICPAGSVLNAVGQCVIQETRTQCPPNSTLNAQGQCVVNQELVNCPPGSSGASGQCVANETTCPPGSTFGPSGQCVVTEAQCPPGSVRNALGQCLSSQVVAEDVPRGGVVVPIAQVPGAGDSRCSRPGYGALVGVVGTNRADRITGTNASDRIFAFGGRDRVSGGRGNDCVEGGSGNDNLDGSNGGDALLGGTGKDILNGGTGRDLMEGGASQDKLVGGSGSDRMFGGDGRDKLSGGLGNDLLDGGAGNDFLEGGNGRDTVRGGSGNDAINVSESGGRDTVDCGPGRDTVRISTGDRVASNCERVLVLRRPRR